jgi:hypothetical protein
MRDRAFIVHKGNRGRTKKEMNEQTQAGTFRDWEMLLISFSLLSVFNLA